MLTTALAVPCLLGYGSRQAYAACVNSGGTTYLCSGAETTTQTINVNNAAVTMDTGATVNTSAGAGNAITVTGDGNLSFTNLVGGTINGAQQGLDIQGGNGVPGGSVAVNTNQSILGGAYGINAVVAGNGALNINSAAVIGTTGLGIRAAALNAASTGSSVTATGAVSGGTTGIYAFHGGAGTLTVNAAAVTGTTGIGIRAAAVNGPNTGTSVTATGAVIGGTTGIEAVHSGTGALTINAAAVTGTTGNGISARALNAASTDVNVTATGAVSGGATGIYANQGGTGALTINAAAVTGTMGRGIHARSTNAAGTDLNVTATGAVSGGTYGIDASHAGSGMLNVNATAVTGATNRGISALSGGATGTGMSVTATGAVTGQTEGIYIRHAGSGTIAINAASVTGTTSRGISALATGAASTGMSVTASGDVTGTVGINANHGGSGALTINTTSVTGTAAVGIYGNTNLVSGTELSIASTGAVTGQAYGIFTRHVGTGALTINATSVTGTTGPGIRAVTTQTTNTGGISLTATGAVTGTTGIYARHGSTTGTLSVNATSVTGTTQDGIYARNTGGASAAIAVTGAVNGTARDGIRVNSSGSNTINIAVGGSVTGATNAINTTPGATGSADTVDNSGAVNANILLGDGTNVVNNRAGATITADLTTGTGNDTFANDGTFTGNANLGDGTNVVTNTSLNSFVGDLTTGAGNDTVTNTGTWTGNVDLGGGSNVFNNSVAGIFNTLNTVNVGAGNVLNNAGTISPGGMGTLQTTTVTGNFVQSGTGTFAVDVDQSVPAADTLTVSGTADVAGSVLPNLLSGVDATGQVDILTAAGGVTDSGLNVTDTVAADYTLLFPDANTVALGFAVDFTPTPTPTPNQLPTGGLTPNQTRVGDNLNTVFAAGSGDMTSILSDLLGITDVTTYLAALDRLHGEHYLTQVGLLRRSNHAFVENLLSCPSTLDGAAVKMVDDKCLWARVSGRAVEIDRSTNTIGGDETSWGFSGGYEAPIREDLRAGFSFAIESSNLDANNGASSDGTRFTAGAKIEKAFEALEASVGLYGGVASYDTTRTIGLAGVGPATSDHDIGFGSVVGRVSHTFETGALRIVPMLDVAATYVSYGSINETGAGAANLTIDSSDEWVFSATPAIGVMGNVAETETYKINASLKGGVSLYSSSSIGFSSRFAGAPAGTPSFTTKTDVDDVVGNLSGAIEMQMTSGTSVMLGYEGGIGDTTQSHGGFARVVLPF